MKFISSVLLISYCLIFLERSSSFTTSSYTTTTNRSSLLFLQSTSSSSSNSSNNNTNDNDNGGSLSKSKRLKSLAKSIVIKPVKAFARPDAIAGVLWDAAGGATTEARKSFSEYNKRIFDFRKDPEMDIDELVDNELIKTAEWDDYRMSLVEAQDMAAVEAAVNEMVELTRKRVDDAIRVAEEKAAILLEEVRKEASASIHEAELAASQTVELVKQAAMASISTSTTNINNGDTTLSSIVSTTSVNNEDGVGVFHVNELDKLAYTDINYALSEMAPPFLNEDECLVPGEPSIRIEKAPENSRRIFAGIDILATVDDVWQLLTDYEHLQDVVPNLVKNDVLEVYDGNSSFDASIILENERLTDEEKLREISYAMKGAKMKQVGGAKVVGINFSARTTLEVREWPNGMPDLAHFYDELYEGKTRDMRAKEEKAHPLQRYHFPRPFAVSSLPTKDISMQSIENDDGEFRLYQGVWRMQPLPGCARDGDLIPCRLTYAVEISPRAYLPVGIIENRIAMDLCANLLSIRDAVSNKVKQTV